MQMRSTGRRLAAAASLLVLQAVAQAEKQGYPYTHVHPNTLSFSPITIQPPQPARWVMDNGIIVFFLEDHELPLVSASAYFGVRSIYAPDDKRGLAGFTGAEMRTGGAGERTGDEIDEELEFLSASVESSIGGQMGTAGLSVLKKDVELGMSIFADVIRRPRFAQDKLDLRKAKAIEGIKRRNDDPDGIVSREFTKLIYGADSVWARQTEIFHVQGITRQDMVDFHAKYYAPNNMRLAVAGDLSRGELEELLTKHFGDWKRKEVTPPQIDPIQDNVKNAAFHIVKDVNQTKIRMGHLGWRRHDPDTFAIWVLNEILGSGGFSSRLMKRVRSDEGLAYSVWSVLSPNTDLGLFRAGASTKVESTGKAISLMKEIIGSMTTAPPTPEELKLAHDSMINQNVFEYESSAGFVNTKARYEYLGYPDDHLVKYPENVLKVTAEDVQRVAKRLLHPDRMVLLIVGPEEAAKQIPADFGPVTKLELVDPEEAKPRK